MRKLLLVGVLILAAVLIIDGITWGLPNIGSWSADDSSGTPDLAFAMRLGNTDHKYPPLQRIISVAAYAPFVGYWYLTGQLRPATDYPYGFADIYAQVGLLLLIRRIITALMGMTAVALSWMIVQHLTRSRLAAAAASLALLFNYYFLFYAKTGNVDIPMLMWLLATLYCWLHALERPTTKWYVLTAVFAACAFATKDMAIAMLAPMAILLGCVHVHRGWRWNTRLTHIVFSRMIIWGALAFIIVYGITSLFFFYPQQISYRLGLFSGSGWGVAGYDQGGWLAVLGRTLWLTAASMTWPLLVIGLAGLVWGIIKRRWLPAALIIPLIGYYAITVGRVGFVFDKYTMPISIVIAIGVGLAVAAVEEYRTSHRIIGGVIMCAIVAALLFAGLNASSVDRQMNADSRYAVEEYVRTLPPGTSVETYDASTWQPRYGLRGVDVLVVEPINVSPEGVAARQPDVIIISENFLRTRFDVIGLEEAKHTGELLQEGSLNYTLAQQFGNTSFLFAPPRDDYQYEVQRVDPIIFVFRRTTG